MLGPNSEREGMRNAELHSVDIFTVYLSVRSGRKFRIFRITQARSQDFLWGGGTQYVNVGMIRYASSKNTQDRVTNLRTNLNRGEF